MQTGRGEKSLRLTLRPVPRYSSLLLNSVLQGRISFDISREGSKEDTMLEELMNPINDLSTEILEIWGRL